MSKNLIVAKRWAVLYSHSDSGSKYSKRRVFMDYESALKCFNRGCNFIDSDYDGYNYVALLWSISDSVGYIPVACRDNLGCSWDIEEYADG